MEPACAVIRMDIPRRSSSFNYVGAPVGDRKWTENETEMFPKKTTLQKNSIGNGNGSEEIENIGDPIMNISQFKEVEKLETQSKAIDGLIRVRRLSMSSYNFPNHIP